MSANNPEQKLGDTPRMWWQPCERDEYRSTDGRVITGVDLMSRCICEDAADIKHGPISKIAKGDHHVRACVFFRGAYNIGCIPIK